MLSPRDLIRLGELVKLAAATARAFSSTKSESAVSAVHDAARRIELAADDLMRVGHELDVHG